MVSFQDLIGLILIELFVFGILFIKCFHLRYCYRGIRREELVTRVVEYSLK